MADLWIICKPHWVTGEVFLGDRVQQGKGASELKGGVPGGTGAWPILSEKSSWSEDFGNVGHLKQYLGTRAPP